ncbi:MAG TPA: disulfide bond formation protein B [Hyphomicrobiaceae bacterium]|nr:disulfide bond formation protein B [Hyphomicrobiaceae bacterium]
MSLETFSNRTTTRTPAYAAGAMVLLAALAVIIAALAFEHIGGHVPCELCLRQRWPYYVGIPLAFLALVLLSAGQAKAAALLFLAAALGFLLNAGFGVHQVGVEWGYWPGPATCSGNAMQPLGLPAGGDLLKSLQTVRIARCDAPTWHFLGLSFAGWNVPISLALAVGALKAAYDALGRSAVRL